MTPDQFLVRIAKQPLAPAYLFLGPEAYQRRLCKLALLDRALPGETRHDGLTLVGLDSLSLAELLDDARSLSLFSSDRVVWAASAEAALPRRIAAASDSDEDGGKAGLQGILDAYLKKPTPGTTIVFECSRYEFSGDDKAKLDRVAKFYSAIPNVVEFRPFTPESARAVAQDLVRRHNLKLGGQELASLVEAVGGDAALLAIEIEKLALYAGTDRKITLDDIRVLVPNASQSTVFTLVNALGRRDRAGALRSLDVLVRQGEYLPLALTFLGTQFRLALAAQEARLNSPQQALTWFTKQGVRMWRDRAEQVMFTAEAFRPEQLHRGLRMIYDADKGLRDTRPDDRIVVESLVLELTAR